MNISFTEKQEKYIAHQLQSGDFQNASEVVRDALAYTKFSGTGLWKICEVKLIKDGMHLSADAA